MPSKEKKSSSKKNEQNAMQAAANAQYPGNQFNQFPQFGFPGTAGYPFFGSCQNAMPGYGGFPPPPQPTQQPFQQPPQQQQPGAFASSGFYPAYPTAYPGYYHH